VKRGDYQVIHAKGSLIIKPLDFASAVESGMVLEMSIVSQGRTAFEDSREKFPRCDWASTRIVVGSSGKYFSILSHADD
jgi:hypothetical protein